MISLNTYLIVYLGIYLVSFALYLAVDLVNFKYLKKHGQKVPVAFEGIIDEQELKKISLYTTDNIRFQLFQTSVGKTLFLFIILSGILPWFAESIAQVNFLLAGLIFFAALGFVAATIGLPFDYYHSFIVEDRYGFNTKTLKIWFSDLLKSMLVTIVVGTFLLSAILLMLRYAGKTWWIWAWAVLLGFQLLMTILYPTVIAPLFNKFTLLEDSELKDGIERLAEGEDLNVEGIFQMDATKRTRHTNAYFSGLGKAKRIVLFDSLIQSHSKDEILAILAHEIGHLKKNHIKKHLAVIILLSLLLFSLLSQMMLLLPFWLLSVLDFHFYYT